MENSLSRLGPAPLPLTSLIGRDEQIASILQLLRTPMVRIVTLSGPGGVGKTRLAIELAHRIGVQAIDDRFPDGVVYLPVAQVRDPDRVFSDLASILGLRDTAEQSAVELLPTALEPRRALLVFDNLEHLLPQAGEAFARLLSRCPGITVLVTSRVRLQVNGERVIAVQPLALPPERESTVATIAESPAVQLFLERSRAVGALTAVNDDDLQHIVEICRRLDGLPLAIEMAAAWTRIFALASLLDRLSQRLPLLISTSDEPSRQRSMREVIAWSYDLLTPEQQRVFGRLAVFEGRFRLDAALSVTADRDEALVLGAMRDLVDRSLLSSEPGFDEQPRFSMLETIHEFAREQLEADHDAETISRRHLAWYVARAAELGSANRWTPLLFENLRAERDNLAVALRTSLALNRLEDAEFVISALGRWWLDGGNIREAQGWYERILELSPLQPNDRLRGLTTRQLGIICWYKGEFRQAEIWLMRALAFHVLLDDSYEIARDKNYLASVAETKGDVELAIQHFRDAHAVFASVGDDAFAALMLEGIADMEYRRGNLAEANAGLIDALAVARRVGNPIILGVVLGGMAQVASERDDLDGAWAALDECLELHDHDPSPTRLSDTLTGYARAAGLAGDPRAAAALLGKVEAIIEAMGVVRVEHFEQHARAMANTRDQMDSGTFESAFQRGRALSTDDAIILARDRTRRQRQTPAPISSRDDPSPIENLTPREREILSLLVLGRTNQDIANELFVQLSTVKTHIANIYGKFGVTSRTAAVAYVLGSGAS